MSTSAVVMQATFATLAAVGVGGLLRLVVAAPDQLRHAASVRENFAATVVVLAGLALIAIEVAWELPRG